MKDEYLESNLERTVAPIANELESARKAVKSNYNAFMFGLAIPLMIILAYFDFKSLSKGQEPPFLLIVATLVVFIGSLVVGRRITKKYRDYFKQRLFGTLVRQINPNLHYEHQDHIPTFTATGSVYFDITGRGWGLENRQRTLEGYGLGKGTIKNIPLQFSFLYLKDKKSMNKADNETHLMAIADLKTKFNGVIFIMPVIVKRVYSDSKRFGIYEVNTVETGHQDFDKTFAVYTSDPGEALSVLSRDMMELLVLFRQKAGAEIFVTFRASSMYITVQLRDSVLKWEPPLFNRDLKLAKLSHYYRYLELCATAVDFFSLDTRFNSTPDR